MRRCLSATIMLGALLSLATCLYSGYGYAAEPSISCTLSTPKSEYLVGEPLELRLALKNEGVSDVTFIRPESVGAAPSSLEVLPPGTLGCGQSSQTPVPQEIVYGQESTSASGWSKYSPSFHKSMQPRFATLAPGQILEIRGQLLSCAQADRGSTVPPWLLSMPGTYRFRVSLWVNPRKPLSRPEETSVVHSNEIDITVKDPEGDEAKTLESWAKSLKDSAFSLEVCLASGRASQMPVLHERPDSIYAAYVQYALAKEPRIMFDEELQGQTGTEYQASLLEKVLSHGSRFPLRDAAMLRLAELYAVQNRYSDAVNQLEQLIAEMPDSMFADKAEERLAGLEERAAEEAQTGE
jgi:hypothetical protein